MCSSDLPAALVLPDLLYYLLWRPDVLSLKYSGRHLLNPLRTLANWEIVEVQLWGIVPLLAGLTGVLAYLVLIYLGMRVAGETAEIDDAEDSPAAAEQTRRADAIY